MKKITFITTAQPTTNPRLIKEAEYLKYLGYDVKVIVCFYEKWAEKFDVSIISKNPEMYIFCGGSPFGNLVDKLVYYKTRLRQRLCQEIFRRVQTKNIAEMAISRAHTEALYAAKKSAANLFIAHNLGALPAAVIAAAFCNAKVGYDAEDMDSGQYLSKTDFMYLLNLMVEQKYFPKTHYFTAASPLIAGCYKNIYPFLNPMVINNVFPRLNLPKVENRKNEPLKLFWFSQTVGIQRGIEDIIKAIGKIEERVEFHLLGDCSAETKSFFTQIATEEGLSNDQIIFYEPILPEDIFSFATKFDIGMATETGFPLNRDICLTNKIFTYIQSGIAVIASDTQAQSLFMQQYPQTGKIYDKGNLDSLVISIKHYIENPGLLLRTKQENYQLGQAELNWETESKKFIKIVTDTLNY